MFFFLAGRLGMAMSRLAAALDLDDDAAEFFSILLPTLISSGAWRQNLRKRKRTKPKKKDGRVGRRWQQRKKGDLFDSYRISCKT